MSEEARTEREVHPDGVVQLRFNDVHGEIVDLNAAELAEVLTGLVEFTSDLAKDGAFGDGPPPEVRVRPPRKGSFILEAVVAYTTSNPYEALTYAGTAGGAVVKGLDVGLKKLRGVEPADFDHLDDGTVKVKWSDGTVDQVPEKAWKRLNRMKRRTKGSLRKILAPMGDDVDTIEVRDGGVSESTEEILETPVDVVADRRDYREAAVAVDDVEEDENEFEAEAQFRSIDFRAGQKWRVRVGSETRQASMEDEDFLRQLDHGLAVHKNDIFRVTIREAVTTKNGRRTREWALTHVVRLRQGSDDDNGGSLSTERSEDA